MSSLIHIKTNPNLSPKHIEFNKLVIDIEKLRTELSREEEKLELFSDFHTKNIRPVQEALCKCKLEMVMALDEWSENSKLPNTTMTELELIIPELLAEAFEFIPSDETTGGVFEKWAGVGLSEVLHDEKMEQLEELEDFMKSMGVDLDLKGINYDDPDSMAEFHKRVSDAREQLDKKKTEKKAARKRSKKQMAAEESKIIQDAIKNKNLRTVYLSLAKILHPDNETDPSLKLEKEEVMKQVTKAYEDKDIITLLVIETQWLKNTQERLANIKEDVASIYIQLLKEQTKKLRQEKAELRFHFRFQNIASFVGEKVERGLLRLALEKEKSNKELRKTQRELDIIKTSPRNEVKKFIKSMAQRWAKDPKQDFMSILLSDRFY